MKDNELMLLLKQGNEEAFDILYEKYRNSVYRYIISLIGSCHEVEDLFHEVFLSIYKNRKSYAAIAKFKTYLFTVTRSKCIDFLRKKKIYIASMDEMEVDFADPAGNVQEKNVFTAEVIEDYNRLLEDFAEETKTALVLRDIEMMDYKSIAEIMDRPLGSVKNMIHRGRAKIYNKLRKHYV